MNNYCLLESQNPQKFKKLFFLSLCLFHSVCVYAVRGISLEPTYILFKRPYLEVTKCLWFRDYEGYDSHDALSLDWLRSKQHKLSKEYMSHFVFKLLNLLLWENGFWVYEPSLHLKFFGENVLWWPAILHLIHATVHAQFSVKFAIWFFSSLITWSYLTCSDFKHCFSAKRSLTRGFESIIMLLLYDTWFRYRLKLTNYFWTTTKSTIKDSENLRMQSFSMTKRTI